MSTMPTMRNIVRDRGSFITIAQQDMAGTTDHIPAHVYDVGFNPDLGLVLIKDRRRFNVSERKYGNHKKWFQTITSNYDRHNPSMGVLMIGYKGTGKSMLAEDICNWGLGMDLPVLFINQAVPVRLIHGAISTIGPCIVYFDEFGKSYKSPIDERGQPVPTDDDNNREKMITLFSDTSHLGVMFIVTGNSLNEFSDFMIDRPGRFEYRLNFDTLGCREAKEIAEEFKLNDWQRDFLLRHTVLRVSSFDIATKVAKSLRSCKTIEEAIELFSVLNVPAPAWYSYQIQELWYKGERTSGKHHLVRCENDTVYITIRDSDLKVIGDLKLDMFAPEVELISRDERVKETDPDHDLPLGLYAVTVDDFKVVFERRLHDARSWAWSCARSVEDDHQSERERQAFEARRNAHVHGGAVGEFFPEHPGARFQPAALNLS